MVITAAGCGSRVKQYPDLLGEPFDTPVFDFAEFLAERFVPERFRRVDPPIRVAMHDACHLQHGQGITDAPRRLLADLPGVEPVELRENYCCGSAGAYNLFQPRMARRLLDRKLDAIEAAGADVVLSSNPGCTLWIRQGLAERGHDIPVLHLAEILSLRLN